MALKPSQCLNLNVATISGIITGTPSYTPHAEHPRRDAMHFMMYQFIGGRNAKGRTEVINHIVVQCYGAVARFVHQYCEPGDQVVGIGFMKTNNPDKGQYRTEFQVRQLQKPRTEEYPGSAWVFEYEDVLEEMPEGTTLF